MKKFFTIFFICLVFLLQCHAYGNECEYAFPCDKKVNIIENKNIIF